MKIKFTQRGFAFAEFEDTNGEKCSVQDSSSAFEAKLWLGQETGTHHLGQCSARMHLTQRQVAELMPILQRFVETGSISRKEVEE